jgi:hypothetical protein
MKKITFTIKGNQEDPEGNPIPYTRVVHNALWLPGAKRYKAWKDHVRKEFFKNNADFVRYDERDRLVCDEPLTTKPSERARMEVRIFWMNGVHGDPDNIFKGIADALFKSDKFLDGSFESCHARDGKGKVDVRITMYTESNEVL